MKNSDLTIPVTLLKQNWALLFSPLAAIW